MKSLSEVNEDFERSMDLAKELADKAEKDAKAAAASHKARLSRVVLAFEKVLFEENMSWRDFTEVLDIFNVRNNAVIPNLKMKEIKDFYGRSNH